MVVATLLYEYKDKYNVESIKELRCSSKLTCSKFFSNMYDIANHPTASQGPVPDMIPLPLTGFMPT